MNQEKKAPLSCRVAPELKERLLEDAAESGYTTSNFVEVLLREHYTENGEGTLVDIQAELADLRLEKQELLATVEMLQERLDQQGDLVVNTPSPPNGEYKSFLPFNMQRLERSLTELRKAYPKLSDCQIIELSIACCLYNDDKFVILYTIKDYIRRNRNFFVSQNNVA